MNETIPEQLAELKRLASVASAAAPEPRKGKVYRPKPKDLDMLTNLLEQMDALISKVGEMIQIEQEGSRLEAGDPMDSDLLTALTNLGCEREKAIMAVKKAMAEDKMDKQMGSATAGNFDVILRRALQIAQKGAGAAA